MAAGVGVAVGAVSLRFPSTRALRLQTHVPSVPPRLCPLFIFFLPLALLLSFISSLSSYFAIVLHLHFLQILYFT